MKKKVERYLSNNGKDEIRYHSDGRFNFNGDLEGVLASVRFDDGSGAYNTNVRRINDNNVGIIGGGTTAAIRRIPNNNNKGILVRVSGILATAQTPQTQSTKKTTFSADFSNNRSGMYANSASRNLFRDSSMKRQNVCLAGGDVDYDSDFDVSNNLFISPPPKKTPSSSSSKKKQRAAGSDQKRQLRSTFTTGRASILETPRDDNKTKKQQEQQAARTPPPSSTPNDDNNVDLRGFTPLSMNKLAASNQYDHQEGVVDINMLNNSGLFSPGWPLSGKEFVVDEDAEADNINNVSSLTFAEGLKTPMCHASDRPRLCIANVRFGGGEDDQNDGLNNANYMALSEEDGQKEKMQREVAISPICREVTLSALKSKRKRRSLFGDDGDGDKNAICSKRKHDGGKSYQEGVIPVTPSGSLTSPGSTTTVTTLPLTVRSKASPSYSGRATLSLEELSKRKKKKASACPIAASMEPTRHVITQDTPPSAISDTTTNYDKQKQQQGNGGTPGAEKFWSSVGHDDGLNNFTPFKQ